MIITGAQIRAARALAGLRLRDLAAASQLHVNAVSYWERFAHIPDKDREPYAVRKMREALEARGIRTFDKPTPGVRMARPLTR